MDLKLAKYIEEEKIQEKIKELGATLTDKFKGKDVVAICILKGSFMFFSDLIRAIDLDCACEFFGVSSYGNNTKTTGEVKLTLDLATSVKDKHVIIVEDIVDTGLTMNYLLKALELRQPESITTVSLLHKPAAKKVEYQLDHVGFEIPNDFVVGYGLDYQGYYRNLPYIATIQNLN